ncbi:MAG TPA: cysteine--tRNA ligase [Actinomycetales bacterium]|nr:cysteine--tRNA ligase [Actinomycetales bacterium]
MSLHLFDTATRSLREFVPLRPGAVGMYICGLTVQGDPHIGHIRFTVAFDQLRRWLELGHGYDVTLIRNVTDIDDKILAKSADAGVPWWAWAYDFERSTTAALEALGVEPATYEPRAAGHIPEMVELIDELVKRGHAYAALDGSGDVYFDVRSWPEYGSLTHQSLDDLAPAEDADPGGKRDPRDFALWKAHKPTEPLSASWPTPYGRGRPGWHLECSAMARKYLGDEFDIHGGGIDLRFPHHENEQAQSRAAGLGFARYWLHNGWVTTGGEKMSKSLGNSLVVSQMLKSVRPLVLRYYLGAAHYRSMIEYTPDSIREADAAVSRIEGFVRRAVEAVGDASAAETAFPEAFREAMDDDLNVSGALAVLHETVRAGNSALETRDLDVVRQALAAVLRMASVLGIDPTESHWGSGVQESSPERAALEVLLESALAERAEARREKDFGRADAIRARLSKAGIVIEDTPQGARWTLEGRS